MKSSRFHFKPYSARLADPQDEILTLACVDLIKQNNEDRESIQYKSMDQGKPPRAATASLQVDVTDSDDLSPKFTKDVYRTQIMEFYPVTL
ncbi:hypothetical protein J6590_048789 [Homalodisca vitripennis]|nr:hypothetical protein J6590_048789 [Homalodisca vitripennis]